jgi:hypothetical protein
LLSGLWLWLLYRNEPLNSYIHFRTIHIYRLGYAVFQCFWNIATNRNVAGSIHDGFVNNFLWHNSSGRKFSLGSTQPLTERIPGIFPGLKLDGAYGWQHYHIHLPIVLISRSPGLLEPSGPVKACNGIALLFTYLLFKWVSLKCNRFVPCSRRTVREQEWLNERQ